MASLPTNSLGQRVLALKAELGVGLFAFILALWSQSPALKSHFVVNNDTRMHTFWMVRWQQPELFQNDLITTYASAYQPWGYLGLYRLASLVVSPLGFSRLLPLLLLPLLAVVLYRLGRDSLPGPASAWAGLVAAGWGCLAPVVLQKMAGGHARAFALPLLALACWLVVRRAWKALGVALFVASLFYPLVTILGGLTAVFGGWRWRERRLSFPGWRELALSLTLSALVSGSVVLLRAATLPSEIGGVASRADIEGQPELSRQGVYPVLPTPSPWVVAAQELRRATAALPPTWTETPPRDESLGGKADPLDWVILGLVGMLLGSARPLRLPAALPALFAGGFVAFWVADLLLLQLYLPLRYLQYSSRLVLPWLAAALAARLLEKFSGRFWKVLLVSLLLLPPLANLMALRGAGLEDFGKRKKLYVFLARTPVDAMIAAHPRLADGVPLFSLRRVFVDFEHAQAFYPRYWATMKARTRAFFAAYYAADQAEICRFLADNAITHLVVERRHFKPNVLARGGLYFEPFDSEIRAHVQGRDDFYLKRLPRAKTVYWQGETAVVTPGSLGCLETAPPPSPPPANPAAAPPGS